MKVAELFTFVSEKLAGLDTPDTVALTTYEPVVLFAVNDGEVATPCAFVVAVAAFAMPGNVPLVPLAGAVNVTIAPLINSPRLSVTVASSGMTNGVFTVAVCGVPLVGNTTAADDAAMAIGVQSLALAPDAPPPDTLTSFCCGELASLATSTITVMGG
jgi:hypothetical protein